MKKELTITEFAKMGGQAVLKKLGRKHFVKMGKKSGEVRKKNRKAN